MNIDVGKVRQAAKNGIPLVIQTALLPPQTEIDLDEILGIFLQHLDLDHVRNHVSYCLKELTGNAKKANTKRAYFHLKGLNIQNPVDYETGMAHFKKETLHEIDRYLETQENLGLHIRITFLVRDQVLVLRVSNNAPLTPTEKARAEQRIAQAKAYESMEQAFGQVLDEAEGAGLGLTILILMLRKLGLPDKVFTLESEDSGTSATLRIPAAEVHVDLVETLTVEMAAWVDKLPPFPENLRQLMVLLDQPDVVFEDLAGRLSLDPALTSDLIRYINSAGKGRKSRVTNLRDAVGLVGLQGIREMIMPYATQKLLGPFIERQKELWVEAQRTSFLALGLAKELNFERQERDLAQIGGLLSSLGKIVVAYLHPERHTQVQAFCRQKKLSPDRFNDLTQIINPAELGAKVAEKWKFPTNLIEVLRFQAWPANVSPELYPVTCAIHLAVNLNSVEQGQIASSQIDEAALVALNLEDPQKLAEMRWRIDRTAHS